ncbi:MAG: hypothetical protein V7641_483 [Blastocatellia bacterium]
MPHLKAKTKSSARKNRGSKKPLPSVKGISKEPEYLLNQRPRFDGERRVVLFDLDGTLMDSGTAWRECAERAIHQLMKILPRHWDVKTALDAYRAIYQSHASITGKIGPQGHLFEDVRQEWNTRTSYALLLAWVENPTFPPHIGDIADTSYYATALDGLLNDPEQLRAILKRAEEIRDTWHIERASHIDRAVEDFWNGDFSSYIYPGVRELLHNLRENQIEYYIATEGHLPTQWRKIRAIGLDQNDPEDPEKRPWVTPEQLLATSQAARPQRALRALNSLSEWYRGRAAANREAITVLPDNDPNRSQLEIAAQASGLISDGLAIFTRLFPRLAKKISKDAAGEVQPEFYARVLYAIHQAPKTARKHLMEIEGLRWENKPNIHLAMIGDKYDSDVDPVIRLAETLGTKIMSIWVRQGSHGAKEPKREPGWQAKWSECDTIAEAGKKYLLSDQSWFNRTESIKKSPPLFVSAIEPIDPQEAIEINKNVSKPAETIEQNIIELLAGIGAVRSNSNQNQEGEPGQQTMEQATSVVDNLLAIIVSDIRLSQSRDKVIDTLLTLCLDPILRDKTGFLAQCAGLPNAAVELLLAVAEEDDDTKETGRYHECLKAMATLLDVNQASWAAAVVDTLAKKKRIKDYICKSGELSLLFLDKLGLLTQPLPDQDGFPIQQAVFLYAGILPAAKRNQTTTNATPRTHTPSANVVTLGRASKSYEYQQRVYLGRTQNGPDVHCFLGGLSARNIVCICGGVQSGKSSTLTAFVKGALLGTSLDNKTVIRSSVIAFHQYPIGRACELVTVPQRFGLRAEVFAFEPEFKGVQNLYRDQLKTPVSPLKFNLRQLSPKVIHSLLKLREADHGAFDAIYEEQKSSPTFSIDELIHAVGRANFREKRRIGEIQRALREIQPLFTTGGQRAFHEELEPGKLMVVHYGLNPDRAKLIPVWDAVLSILAEPLSPPTPSEHYLLIFDELRAVFPQKLDNYEAQLSERLAYLASMGRHVHVSILAASQQPVDFYNAKKFVTEASVLLLHKLDAPVSKVPEGMLWEIARRQPYESFKHLAPGQAWYCSGEQNHEMTGNVQISLDF